jgi:F-type H+-transporting ATPase subunit epsilon
MPDPFHFELVSPERLMFSGEVEAVIVPGTEGQFTVLKDHAPLMTRLKPGIVEVDETASKKSRLFVRGGFADVAPSGLTILAEVAMPVEEFDAAAITAQIKDAEEDVADATSDEQKRLANEKLDQLRELREALAI